MPAKPNSITRRQAIPILGGSMLALADSKISTRAGDLKIAANRRFVTYADGAPFFYLGDTAWELFHRLNREDAGLYLDDRARKRFTVIQAVVLAEFDGLHKPNAYGQIPLRNDDPTKPNERYFEHVDYIVKAAERRGLYIGMLPTWGNKVVKGSWEKTAQVIFDPENAYPYGRWLGERYRNTPNLIWILGGDRNPAGVEAVWRNMARGLREGDRGRHLITFHPGGGQSSADLLHVEPWLDFNMIQSGHSVRDNPNYAMIQRDYERTPIKPCMDGEPRYENHPVNWKPELNGWFDQHDVRQAAYWALLAGAHGHTYGCHDIWQFLQPGREPVGFARGEWKASLDLPGATQMTYLRQLAESRPMLSRIPDPSVLAGDPGIGAGHMVAARGDGYAFVYSPLGNAIAVKLGSLRARMVRASWFNPRTGEISTIGEYPGRAERQFAPADTPARSNDWILVLDDASGLYR